MTTAEKILEMKQERASITIQIRSIMDEFEGQEIEQTKKDELRNLETDFDKLNERLIAEERQLERERLAGEANARPEERKDEDDAEKRVMDAFLNHMRNGDEASYREYRTLQQDNPTQAGYLVAPQQFVNQIIGDLNNILFFRQLSNVLPPLSGAQSLGYPKRTARMSSFAWGTELAAPTADTSLAFGKREFKPKPGTSEILVSKTLARNVPSLDSYLRGEIAYDVGVGLETAYMSGSGVGQPLGIFTASADGISTSRDVSTGNTISEPKFDGLMEAKYSIKEQYQNNLSWIFHRDAVKRLAKLKDADGQYVWQQSVVLGTPDRLMGFPVRMSEYCPNTFSSGLYVGILGDFKTGYWICDSMNLEIQVLMELYARTNQVDYITRLETDGMPVIEECFARVKLA